MSTPVDQSFVQIILNFRYSRLSGFSTINCFPFKFDVSSSLPSATYRFVPISCIERCPEQCYNGYNRMHIAGSAGTVESVGSTESILLRRSGCCSWCLVVFACAPITYTFEKLFKFRMNITSAGIVKRQNLIF
jgi:hypothetical protein